MAQKEINTEITIQATPAKVWQILTEVDKYPNWNPFIRSFKGKLAVGEKLNIQVNDMKFKPELLVVQKNKELKWLGKFLFKGLFDGEHRFAIQDNGDGTVTFQQSEVFSGLLVGLFSKKLDTETKPGFEKMNEALKELAEK